MVKTIFQGPNADGPEMAARSIQQIICNLLSLAESLGFWICPSGPVIVVLSSFYLVV